MHMRTRVVRGYALVLMAVWVIYGAYSIYKSSGQALMIFLFSFAFAVVLSGMFFFSAWMMRQYKLSDRLLQTAIHEKAHQTRRKRKS